MGSAKILNTVESTIREKEAAPFIASSMMSVSELSPKGVTKGTNQYLLNDVGAIVTSDSQDQWLRKKKMTVMKVVENSSGL